MLFSVARDLFGFVGGSKSIDLGLCTGVVANLEVGIFEEVHGMHFVVHHMMMLGHTIGDLNGGKVGVDVVLPKT